MVQARFNPTVYNVTSNAGNVNLMVQKNGVSGTPILVTVSTTDLTAKGIYQCSQCVITFPLSFSWSGLYIHNSNPHISAQ